MKIIFNPKVLFILIIGVLYNCRIDPIDLEDFNEDIPCDPDVIYFEKDILPIFQSNCAKSGCHDDSTAQKGVNLTSWKNATNEEIVTPNNAEDSELYDVLEDNEMPPYPETPLTLNQVNLIRDWINQGAENLICTDCDSLDITYTLTIYPIINKRCEGCHNGITPQGEVSITNYNQIRNLALNGDLLGVIDHKPSYTPMPFNLPKLPICEINQIKAWIDEGALDN